MPATRIVFISVHLGKYSIIEIPSISTVNSGGDTTQRGCGFKLGAEAAE